MHTRATPHKPQINQAPRSPSAALYHPSPRRSTVATGRSLHRVLYMHSITAPSQYEQKQKHQTAPPASLSGSAHTTSVSHSPAHTKAGHRQTDAPVRPDTMLAVNKPQAQPGPAAQQNVGPARLTQRSTEAVLVLKSYLRITHLQKIFFLSVPKINHHLRALSASSNDPAEIALHCTIYQNILLPRSRTTHPGFTC